MIGTRPGEKAHETLVSSEEAVRAEDCGSYFKIKPEVPGMDIKQYYYKGRGKEAVISEDGYTSANTKQLTVAETEKLLLALPEIKAELKKFKK